jgi:uncharacterized membrane protein
MSTAPHLWAIGYEDMEGAGRLRDEIARLGWDTGQAGKYLILLDLVVVVRHPDGTYTLDRKPFPGVANVVGCTCAGLLAGLVLGVPAVGAAIGAMLGSAGTATATASHMGINKDFIDEVQTLMKPGSSTVFALDNEGDMEVILHTIQGLGGTVLKTNVDQERAKLIQSTLASTT